MKMSDAEIIKAFTICANRGACNDCPLDELGGVERCMHTLLLNTLDLINRLKAENERLTKEATQFADIGKMYSEIKTEARKEFAKFLIDKSENGVIHISDLPDRVKEMG